MTLRKEQGLLLAVVVLLALLVVLGRGDADGARGPAKVKGESYDAIPLGPAVVTDAAKIDIASRSRDEFIRPSLTSVLPPLDWPDLPLPPLPAWPIVEPPLTPGPVLSHWFKHRLVPRTVTLGAEAAAGDASTANGGGAPEPAEEKVAPAQDADYSLTFDRITLAGGGVLWGQVLQDRFSLGQLVQDELLAMQPPFGQPVLFKWVDPARGTVKHPSYELKPEEISRIDLANTIRNRIGMQRRRILPGDPGLPDRELFILNLLANERDHPEALEQAEIQAQEYIEAAPQSPRGHELKAFVYGRTGQLEKELEVYEQLGQTAFKDEAFVVRGRGMVEHRLGLEEDAEMHLREAVRLDSGNAENHLMLSQFLLDGGRGAEALTSAQAARQLVGPGMRRTSELGIKIQLVRALLAVGRAEDAQRALAEAENVDVQVPMLTLLRGAVLYALGQYAEAQTAFDESATSLPDAAMPLIGAGLCRYQQQAYDQALAMFRRAQERDPLERHLALAAQGFLLLQVPGRTADAVSRCEDARILAPRDPYILYLLACAYREAGRLAEARELLELVLRDHHDFVEAIAEKSLVHLREALRGGEQARELIESAERLARRTVEVDQGRGKQWVYQDLLGIIRYHLQKNEAARQAFEASQQWGGDLHAKLWLALLRNRVGATDDALAMLRSVWQFIRDDNDPYKKYADDTMKMLAFHRGQRLFRDTFNAIGRYWDENKRGQRRLVWRVHDGKLHVSGQATSEQPSYLRYPLVNPGSSLVEASVELTVGQGFTGDGVLLRLTDERPMGDGKVQDSFVLLVGYRRLDAYLYLRDGRQETKQNTVEMRAAELGVQLRAGETARLTVRVERGLDGASNRPELVVEWDGKEVLRREARTLNMRSPLWIDLYVESGTGAKIEATFDNFRVIRVGEGG